MKQRRQEVQFLLCKLCGQLAFRVSGVCTDPLCDSHVSRLANSSKITIVRHLVKMLWHSPLPATSYYFWREYYNDGLFDLIMCYLLTSYRMRDEKEPSSYELLRAESVSRRIIFDCGYALGAKEIFLFRCEDCGQLRHEEELVTNKFGRRRCMECIWIAKEFQKLKTAGFCPGLSRRTLATSIRDIIDNALRLKYLATIKIKKDAKSYSKTSPNPSRLRKS